MFIEHSVRFTDSSSEQTYLHILSYLIETLSKTSDDNFCHQTNSLLLKRLARIGELSIVNGNTKPIPHAAKIIITDTQIFLHLEGLIDINKEQTRLKAELDKAEAFIKNTSSRLANASFIAKAPPELIKNTQSLLEEQQRKRIEIQSALKALL